MAEQTCSVPEPDTGINIIHGSDREWVSRLHFVLSENQTGPIKGHYVKLDGSSVLADATISDQKAKLKIHLMWDNSSNSKVVMLESGNSPGTVVAINKANNKVIAKQAPKKLMEYNTLADVVQNNPEMVFYEKPKSSGSDICYFESYLSDKKRILGFDAAGKPLDTTQVDSVKSHAHFRVLSA